MKAILQRAYRFAVYTYIYIYIYIRAADFSRVRRLSTSVQEYPTSRLRFRTIIPTNCHDTP